VGTQREARRLAAILAADMVGYSGLMEADEAGTIARQKAHRKELIDPEIAEHGGRIVKTMGDGILVEFPSVVAAVACAVKMQRAIQEREAELPKDRRIQYRVGINLGDIVIDGDDILGDGVNVASRLEALAEPGGICVPSKVLHEVRNKLDVGYEFIGERKVKNIETPVPAYRVLLEREAAGTIVGEEQADRRRQGLAMLLVAAGIFLVAGSGAWWWQLRAPGGEPTDVSKIAVPAGDKPSIAVLPFANLSDDTEQEWFVDGMTEDLITDLSKISGLIVIARNSAFTYKGKDVNAQEVAEDLNVSHILEGSVRRAGDQLRINVQLIDASTGGHLWADRYDETMDNIFALQDRVARRVVSALAVTLTASDEQRLTVEGTRNIAAYEAFLRGWEHVRRFTPEDFAAARDYFEKAIELDPEYARAYAALAMIYYRGFELRWSRELGVGWDVARLRAGSYLQRALENPTPLAYRVQSEMYLRVKRTDEALERAERALALDPNDPENQAAVAKSLIFLGREEEAIERIETAMSSEVHYPSEYLYLLGLAYFGMERYEEAASNFEEALSRSPENYRIKAPLAASYVYLGRKDDARLAFEEYYEEEPPSHYGRWSEEDMWLRWPYEHQADWDRLKKGLTDAAQREFDGRSSRPGGSLWD